jgi:hypothetical protein
MNDQAIPGAYLFRLYVCDKEMSWAHHIGETHQPKKVSDKPKGSRKLLTFRLTNVIPERIIFVSRGITIYVFFYVIEQHPKFLWHALQLLYMCTICDSTNINTIIEFVPNFL